MNAAAEPVKKVWTEADLQSLPEEGFNHEVVDGELVMSPKNNWFHGYICTWLSAAMVEFNRKHKLGAVLDSSTGFWMFNKNCRAPDISFVSKTRMTQLGFSPKEKRFFPGAPDLAIEVLSPDNARTEIDKRLKDFFNSGTRLAWIINRETESVEICNALTQRTLVGSGGVLEGGDVLPGFGYPIADLFKEWDWD